MSALPLTHKPAELAFELCGSDPVFECFHAVDEDYRYIIAVSLDEGRVFGDIDLSDHKLIQATRRADIRFGLFAQVASRSRIYGHDGFPHSDGYNTS